MAAWKKVLTTDDLGDTTDTNIATDNLTLGSDTSRFFNIGGAANDATARTFSIKAQYSNTGSEFDLLTLRRDESGFHSVFLSALQGAHVGYLGSTNYRLPLANSCSSGGILAGTSSSQSDFVSVESLLQPSSGTAYSHSAPTTFTPDPAADSVIVFDNSEGKFGTKTINSLFGVTGDNLSVVDLTQDDQDRFYYLPDNDAGSSLNFVGTVDGTQERMLKIEADGNSASADDSYVYVNNLRVGSFSLSGDPGENGYAFPPHSSNIGSGEILVSDDFDEDVGSMSFKTFGEYLNPAYGVGLASTSPLTSTSANYANDSYLIFDGSVNGFKHIKLTELRAPQLYHFGSTASGQTVTMRGVNGVQHNKDTNGVTVVKAMNLASLSYSVKKTDTGTGTAKFEIYRNGAKYMETPAVVNGTETLNNEFVHGVYNFTASTGFQQPKVFAPGDWFAVRKVATGTCGTGAHQVTLKFV